MKCQKCNAENINEAVKCGMCGAKLKHTTTFNGFTGSQHVESSIRRDQQSNKQREIPQRPSNSASQPPRNLVETVLNTNLPVQEKARIFLDSWQERARDNSGQPKKPKSKLKWIGFFLFFIFLGLPILEKVGTAVFQEVCYQIRERTRIANEAEVSAESVQDEEPVAAVDAVAAASPELEQEMIRINQEMKILQDASDTYYLEHQRLPSKLSDLKSTEISTIDRDIFANTEMLESGVTITSNVDNPDIKLLYEPEELSNHKISWTCYSVGIEIEESTGCVLLPGNPFAHE